jgi:hypothetical protein
LTFLLGFWQNFVMTTPETLYTKNVINKLSFLLVTHMIGLDTWFDGYEFLNQDSSLDRFWTDWLYRCLVRFFGLKMSETYRGLHTRFEDHLLSFPTPTQTHISDVHSHGYGRFGTATCGVTGLLRNRVNERIDTFGTIMDSGQIATSSTYC